MSVCAESAFHWLRVCLTCCVLNVSQSFTQLQGASARSHVPSVNCHSFAELSGWKESNCWHVEGFMWTLRLKERTYEHSKCCENDFWPVVLHHQLITEPQHVSVKSLNTSLISERQSLINVFNEDEFSLWSKIMISQLSVIFKVVYGVSSFSNMNICCFFSYVWENQHYLDILSIKQRTD